MNTPAIIPEVTAGDSFRACGENTCRVWLYDMDGYRTVCQVLAQSHDDARARAAFIVTACNSHAALVADNARLREALFGLNAAIKTAYLEGGISDNFFPTFRVGEADAALSASVEAASK